MKKLLCSFLALLLPAAVVPAKTVVIPFGTTIFCELDQTVTTRQKEAHAVQTGDIVHPPLVYVIDPDGRVAFAAAGGEDLLVDLARQVAARS